MLDKLMSSIMPLMSQSSNLDIKKLVIVSKELKDGVLISMTSPDKDGQKMAEMFAEAFTGLASFVEGQGVRVITSHLDIDGNPK